MNDIRLRHVFSFLIVFALFFIMGCEENILDQDDRENLSADSFWQTAEDAKKGIVSAYSASLQAWNGSKWTFFEENYLAVNWKSDDIDINRNDIYGLDIAAFSHGPDVSAISNLWRTSYTGIYYANQVIEKVPGILMDETEKKGIIAEAKFLRAYGHFTLLNFFGNIPLVLKTPESTSDFTPSQTPAAQVWDQIEQDLKDAIADLPDSYNDANVGRVTKTGAIAYLGKVHLFQEEWSDAATRFESVINSGVYSLLPSYNDNFNGVGENGSESIFEIQFSSLREGGNDERHPVNFEVTSYALGGWELFYPSEWIFDQFMKDTLSDGSFSERVYASLFFDDPNSTARTTTTGESVSYADAKANLTDRLVFFNKYNSDGEVGEVGNYYGGINMHLMRYADLLLMHAEALNEMGQTTEAVGFVNQVRSRAKVPSLSSSMSAADLRTHIRNFERPVELAAEYSIRWCDLARWSRGSASPINIRQIMIDHKKPFAENFTEGKHEIYPIPQFEMDTNPNLVQNSNW